MNEVDAAGVFQNASTRFADGYRYGFGAELGISNSKLHARGPMGLEGLTTYKYKLFGNGHTVAEYAKGEKKFKHRPLVVADFRLPLRLTQILPSPISVKASEIDVACQCRSGVRAKLNLHCDVCRARSGNNICCCFGVQLRAKHSLPSTRTSHAG